MNIPEPLEIAINELSKLPSVGRKTAQRLALHLLNTDKENVDSLVDSIVNLREKIGFCEDCFNFAVDKKCEICKDTKRDETLICVVEEPADIIAIERTNEFNGLYHVLGGVLSPLSGIDADSLHIRELLERLKKNNVREIILAINPDTEGETTALYLAKQIKPMGIKVSRLASGLPIGGDLEFADEATIGRAVLARVNI